MDYGYIAIYTIEGQKLCESRAHEDHVRSVRISPDMKYFASVSDDGCSKLFLLETYEELHTWNHDGKAIPSGSFSPNGSLWATGDEDGIVRIFDVESRELVRKYRFHNGWIHHIIFSQDGSLIYFGSSGYSFVIQTATGQVLQKMRVPFVSFGYALNQNGTRLLYSGHKFGDDTSVQEFFAS
eukprot:TRINITY_DN3145_c0_g7_i1.p1 TRINITY_DN3145_c0_g7~~TRINITY_DN3145_c0_g7_i1.p1  ORF type:complete len:198 (+),score=36.23 TRINITY_DN3145_c0_g7_i1:51-596(+)